MKVELLPELVTSDNLCMLKLIQVQRPHLYVVRNVLRFLRHHFLVARGRWLVLTYRRSHLRVLRYLMAVVLLTCVHLALEICIGLRCVTQAELRSPAVVPGAAFLDLFDVDRLLTIRLQNARARLHEVAGVVRLLQSSVLLLCQGLVNETDLASELLQLLCLYQVLTHQVSLLLQVNLSLVETIAIRVGKHVLESRGRLRLADGHLVELAAQVALRDVPVRIQLQIQSQVLVDAALDAQARRRQLVLKLCMLLQPLELLQLKSQLAAARFHHALLCTVFVGVRDLVLEVLLQPIQFGLPLLLDLVSQSNVVLHFLHFLGELNFVNYLFLLDSVLARSYHGFFECRARFLLRCADLVEFLFESLANFHHSLLDIYGLLLQGFRHLTLMSNLRLRMTLRHFRVDYEPATDDGGKSRRASGGVLH